MENRVLVVDDEKEIRDFLFKHSPKWEDFMWSWQIREEGLRKIEKDPFDLVLTDLKMPRMDGLQLVDEIAKAKPEVLTVLMTGHGSIDSALEAMKRGRAIISRNRFNLNELMVRLRRVLEERQRFISLKGYAADWRGQIKN